MHRFFTAKNLLLIVFFAAIIPLAIPANAQIARIDPTKTSEVTARLSSERIRFMSPGIVRIKVEVISENGETLLELSSKGSLIDWNLLDANGQPMADGSYACVVTVKSLNGKISQRMGTVIVTAGRAALQAKNAQLTAEQQSSIGPIEENALITVLDQGDVPSAIVMAHDGTSGQVTSTTGALTFRTGDVFSGIEKERMRITEDGKVGIGTEKPDAAFDVAGAIKAREGLTFSNGSTLNVNEVGDLSLTRSDGTVAPEVSGTGTTGRLTKWTDGASGALGDSVAIDTGTGLQLTAAASGSVDTNVLFTSGNDRTTGAIASSTAAFVAANGPYFALRGNAYSAIANQRGLFAISTGNVSSPVGNEGSVIFLTANDQPRMIIKPNGSVGINTTTPASTLDVAGDINTSTQFNLGGNRILSNAGTSNLFAGVGAARMNTSDHNTSFGSQAGGINCPSCINSGNNNSFFGALAGQLNTSGFQNTFIGSFAGLSNMAGAANTFVGSGTGSSVDSGNSNVFVGSSVGINTNSGSNNVFLGNLSGQFNKTGSNNTMIGFAAASAFAADNLDHATAIGAGATVSTSNTMVFGRSNGGDSVQIPGAVGIGIAAPSFKLHIEDSSNAGLRVQTDTANGTVASFGGNGAFFVDSAGTTGGRFSITETGNVGVGIAVANAKLQVVGGDIAVTTATKGVILKSLSGNSCWRILVNDAGTVGTTAVTCP